MQHGYYTMQRKIRSEDSIIAFSRYRGTTYKYWNIGQIYCLLQKCSVYYLLLTRCSTHVTSLFLPVVFTNQEMFIFVPKIQTVSMPHAFGTRLIGTRLIGMRLIGTLKIDRVSLGRISLAWQLLTYTIGQNFYKNSLVWEVHLLIQQNNSLALERNSEVIRAFLPELAFTQ